VCCLKTMAGALRGVRPLPALLMGDSLQPDRLLPLLRQALVQMLPSATPVLAAYAIPPATLPSLNPVGHAAACIRDPACVMLVHRCLLLPPPLFLFCLLLLLPLVLLLQQQHCLRAPAFKDLDTSFSNHLLLVMLYSLVQATSS